MRRRSVRDRQWPGPHDVRTIFTATEATFGGVDIVCNSAGLIGGDRSGQRGASSERIMKVMHGQPGQRGDGDGRIRRCAAWCGLHRQHCLHRGAAAAPTDLVYSATKAGVVRITESCAGLADEDPGLTRSCPGIDRRTGL